MSLEHDGNIYRSVKLMDLRSVKETGAEARRQLLEARKSAIQALASPGARPQSAAGQRVTLSATTGSVGSGFGRTPKAASMRHAEAHAAVDSASSALVDEARAAQAQAEASAAAARDAASAAAARAAMLEDSLQRMVGAFADHVEAGAGAASPYYTVAFGPGAIGMILTTADDGTVEVAELRTDAKGAPLLALACGKISVGDGVVAIADRLLSRNGTPTLESVAAEFKGAVRPVRVLFYKKAPGAPLPRGLMAPPVGVPSAGASNGSQ